MYLVDKCVKWNWCAIGLGSCSFSKDRHGLARFVDCLYEHYDSKRGEHPNRVYVFNYGKNKLKL